MQPSQPSSSHMYPASPKPNILPYDSGHSPYVYSSSTSDLPPYDSGYSSYDYSSPSSFYLSSYPYSNESFYIPSQPDPSYYSPTSYSNQQPFASSTPLQSSNVCLIPSIKDSQTNRRRKQQQSNVPSPFPCLNRKRITDEAVERLNAFYDIKKRPTEAEKDRLAMECNITLAQVNTWFNNARSRRGDTKQKLETKLLKQQINSLNSQVNLLEQQHSLSSSGHISF